VANVFLYNIDDLQCVVDENIRRRAEEIPRAEAIVEYEMGEFVRWSGTLSAVPTIKLLQQRVDDLLESELGRYRAQFSPHEREQIEKFTRSLCNKLLHPPISFLREIDPDKSGGADLAAVDLFRRIFKLEDPSDER
jgi:glutamyl-tRNA reductase